MKLLRVDWEGKGGGPKVNDENCADGFLQNKFYISSSTEQL